MRQRTLTVPDSSTRANSSPWTPGGFPLSIDASGRFLKTTAGTPFFMHADSPWMLPNNLSDAQVDTYVAWLSSAGFTACLIEAPGFFFSDNSPTTNNVDGAAPFTVMSPHYNWVLNDAYWNRVDRFVNACKAAGIFVWIAPAYAGITGGSQGCPTEINAASAGTLQSFGASLANRFPQGNVGWVLGGDYGMGGSTGRAQQWNIVTGIRSVRTTDLVTGHPARGEDSYALWGPAGDNLPGFNVQCLYITQAGSDGYTAAATAFARSPAMPAVMFEAGYEGEVASLASFRLGSYSVMLSGACGHHIGNKPRWDFGSAAWGGGGAANALANALNTTGTAQMGYFKALFTAYAWQKLVPKTDASLVSSALGTGAGRVCPALAIDNTFALIWKNDAASITVSIPGTKRVRWFDPTNGSFTLVSAALSGSQVISHPGNNSAGDTDWVLVLD